MNILLIDDHPIINEGLLTFLEHYPDINIIEVACDGIEGLDKIRQYDPDCVVLDLSMPKLNGLEAIRIYLKEKPQLGIVVFTGHKSENDLFRSLDAGARGFVLKGSPVSVLVNALREVNAGGYFVCPEMNPSIIKRYLAKQRNQPTPPCALDTLSSRERQIFHLLAKGNSLKEIAADLSISIKTVSKHQIAIKKKLRLKNAAEMAHYSLQEGISPFTTE